MCPAAARRAAIVAIEAVVVLPLSSAVVAAAMGSGRSLAAAVQAVLDGECASCGAAVRALNSRVEASVVLQNVTGRLDLRDEYDVVSYTAVLREAARARDVMAIALDDVLCAATRPAAAECDVAVGGVVIYPAYTQVAGARRRLQAALRGREGGLAFGFELTHTADVGPAVHPAAPVDDPEAFAVALPPAVVGWPSVGAPLAAADVSEVLSEPAAVSVEVSLPADDDGAWLPLAAALDDALLALLALPPLPPSAPSPSPPLPSPRCPRCRRARLHRSQRRHHAHRRRRPHRRRHRRRIGWQVDCWVERLRGSRARTAACLRCCRWTRSTRRSSARASC